MCCVNALKSLGYREKEVGVLRECQKNAGAQRRRKTGECSVNARMSGPTEDNMNDEVTSLTKT
jgi:hypothetical protein